MRMAPTTYVSFTTVVTLSIDGRKEIVGMARNLQHLDGSQVLKQERVFLQQLQARKLSRDISRRPTDDNLARARQMLVREEKSA